MSKKRLGGLTLVGAMTGVFVGLPGGTVGPGLGGVDGPGLGAKLGDAVGGRLGARVGAGTGAADG